MANLEQIVKFITKVLDEMRLPQLGQHLIPCLLGEWDFRVGQPRPVVGVGSPRVRVFERKRQTLVDGGHVNGGRWRWLWRRRCRTYWHLDSGLVVKQNQMIYPVINLSGILSTLLAHFTNRFLLCLMSFLCKKTNILWQVFIFENELNTKQFLNMEPASFNL